MNVGAVTIGFSFGLFHPSLMREAKKAVWDHLAAQASEIKKMIDRQNIVLQKDILLFSEGSEQKAHWEQADILNMQIQEASDDQAIVFAQLSKLLWFRFPLIPEIEAFKFPLISKHDD